MTPSLSPARANRFDTIVFSAVLLAVVVSGTGLIGAQVRLPAHSVGVSSPSQTYEGVVSDTRCVAKHSTAIGLAAGDCTIQCIRMGGQFALVDGDASYLLDGDPQLLKRVAGQRVKVFGVLTGNKLEVRSITPN